MTRGLLLWMVVAVAAGLGLRAVELQQRPLHNDEAVNALKFRQLWEGGGYFYDPVEFHGPTLAYSTLLWNKLTLMSDFPHMSETRLRSLPVIFGLGLILLLPLVAQGLGRTATISAAIFTAVSPVMVYYSRDYIHETLFVFFSFLALAAGWRHSQTGKLGWILLAGAAIGLMQATKETFVFNVAAIMGALLLNEFFPSAHLPGKPVKAFGPWQILGAGLAWLVVVVLLFTSFFHNLPGLLDAARTYSYWTQRAGGNSPHINGWGFYWLRLLFFHRDGGPFWTEGFLLLLAVIGGVAVFRRKGLAEGSAGWVRFLVFYTVLLALVYTVLPYKTPWCAIDFWVGVIGLAGVGVAALLTWVHRRALKAGLIIVLLAGTLHLAAQALWQSSAEYTASPLNPWVYAQTLPDILNLVANVDGVAKASPEGDALRLDVIAPGDDYYPLPWNFRRYDHVGYQTNVPGFAKFVPGTLQDVPALMARLLDRSNTVAQFLTRAGITNNLDKDHAGDPDHLERLLITNLNRIIAGPLIYDTNLFNGIRLRPATADLLLRKPQGNDLMWLNRRLLEDACTNEIGVNNLPAEPYAAVTVISPKLEPDVDQTKAGEMVGMFELRPAVFMELYVQTNYWNAYLKAKEAQGTNKSER